MPSLTKPRDCHGDYLLGIKDLVDKTASPRTGWCPCEIEWGKRLLRQWGVHVPSLPSINWGT